jgi:hypothetical protein
MVAVVNANSVSAASTDHMSRCNDEIAFPRLGERRTEKQAFPNSGDAPATPLYYGPLPLLD